MRSLWMVGVLVAGLAFATPAMAQSRSVGQVIDDSAITTQVKAKLTADKLSNLTKIEVKTENGIVHLNGTVDTAERQARAIEIAGSVRNVRGVVNNIHVAGTTVPPATTVVAPPPTQARIDANGIVASVDAATGTITLQDGRMLGVTSDTEVTAMGSLGAVQPGSRVQVRRAIPLGYTPTAAVVTPEWRMGTVRGVDRSRHEIVLTDGTLVRLGPSVNIRRGSERLTLEQIVAGSEVVIRSVPAPTVAAPGSALPSPAATAPVLDASEMNVVWTPTAGLR